MFMRFVQVKVKSERLSEMGKLYEERVIPALQKVPRCLYATLIYSTHHPDECISLTLWETQADAEAYERSGLFRQLLDESKPYFADASEWKIQLSKDLTVFYEPVPEEPVVKSYAVATPETDQVPRSIQPNMMHVRIFNAKIQPGKMEEFEQLYTREVLPVLRTIKGCRYAFLTKGIKENDEIISVTIWDTKEDANEYETGGKFDELGDKVRHTFSDLYQWKMRLEHDIHRPVRTSEDVSVEGYNVVTGKSFQ